MVEKGEEHDWTVEIEEEKNLVVDEGRYIYIYVYIYMYKGKL